MKRILLAAVTSNFVGHQVSSSHAMNMSLADFQQACDVSQGRFCDFGQNGTLAFNYTSQSWQNVTNTTVPYRNISIGCSPITCQVSSSGSTLDAFITGTVISIGMPIVSALVVKGLDWASVQFGWFGSIAISELKDILAPRNPIQGQTLSQLNAVTELQTAETGFNTMLAPVSGVPITPQNNLITDIKAILAPANPVQGQNLIQNNAITDLKTILRPPQGQFSIQNNAITAIDNRVSMLETNIKDKAEKIALTKLQNEVVPLQNELKGPPLRDGTDDRDEKKSIRYVLKNLADQFSTLQANNTVTIDLEKKLLQTLEREATLMIALQQSPETFKKALELIKISEEKDKQIELLRAELEKKNKGKEKE